MTRRKPPRQADALLTTGTPERMLCPACAMRADGAITPDCPVCSGAGRLTLGMAGLALHGPEVTRRAIRLILEAAARHADTTLALGDDRANPIRQAVAQLQEVGLLAQPGATLTPHPHLVPHRVGKQARDNAIHVACQHTQLTLFDVNAIDAPAHPYGPRDRPNLRGLPVLSATGRLSSLAHVCDPADPLTDTQDTVAHQHNITHAARILAAAVPQAAQQKKHTRTRTRRRAA